MYSSPLNGLFELGGFKLKSDFLITVGEFVLEFPVP
jgi:hypothetical protein